MRPDADEGDLVRLNRTLRAISASNWALVHASDEVSYRQEVCRIVVEQCGHAMAWIGFAEEDAEKSVRPVAHYGHEAGYLATLKISWADNEYGRGPTGIAVRTGQARICNNMLTDPAFQPWREQALQRGYASSIGLPLVSDGRTFGALTIYSRQPAPFTEEEVKVLQELSDNLAHGISMLRIRAEHASQEEALRVSEERYRLLVEQTVDGIFVSDAQGRYLDVNPAGAAMLGYTPEEILTLSISDVILPEEVARLGEEVARFAGGAVATSEWHFRRQDGSTFIGEVVGRQIPDGRLQAVLRDVTARRAVETNLREARLAALNLAQDAIQVRGQLERINAQLQAEISERQSMLQELERARMAADAASHAKSEFLANMSHEIRTPLNAVLGLAQTGYRDNAGRRIQGTFNRILQSGQLLLFLINDILDLSKIDAGKMTLEQVEFDLGEMIDRAVDINSAGAFAKQLAFEVEESADLPQRCIGDALRLAQVLVNLLSNAIKFTDSGSVRLTASWEEDNLVFRIRDSGIGMTPEQVGRLFDPFEQADATTTRRFGGTGLGLTISKRLVELMGGTIQVESEPGAGSRFELRLPLPLAAGPCRVKTGTRFVLVGLPEAESAALATTLSGLGGETTRVATLLGYTATSEGLLVVAEDDLSTPALQAELYSRVMAGQHLAVAHTPCNSDQAPLTLPAGVHRLDRPLRARHLLAALEPPPGAADNRQAPGPRLSGYRILAAEDNEVNRLVLEEMLAGEDALLECVENGQQAVERVRRDGADSWDIVLMDIQMPKMDGHEATRLIREFAPDLPIVGLTAHALAEERERCLASGMVAHVTKPVDLNDLVAVIRHQARPPRQTTTTPALPPATPTAAETREAAAPDLPAVDASRASASGDRGRDEIGLIDWRKLEQQFANKPGLVDRLVALVLEKQSETPAKLRAAAAAAAAGLPDALLFQAHALKSVVGNLQAIAVLEEASECEHAARARLAKAPALAEHLAQTTEALLAELAAYVGDSPVLRREPDASLSEKTP